MLYRAHEMTEQGRTLSDADVDAIAARLENRLADRLVRGAGNGALAFLKRLIVALILIGAGYAASHGWKP